MLKLSRPITHPNSIRTQGGWTLWSLLFVAGVILLFAYVGMQLVPIYSANENVKNAMERSIDNQNLRTINRNIIVKGMKAQLFLDGNSKIIDYRTDLKVQRSPKAFRLTTTYQREVPMFYNVYLLVKFDNVIERDLSSS